MIKLHHLTYLSVILLSCFIVNANCNITPVPFNVTVGYSFQWKTDSFTNIGYEFLTEKTSGVAVYTDLSENDQFNSYSIPSNLKGYDLYGVFQIDMQKVNIPLGGASFSFTHSYIFGILNVNPKELVLVGVDMDMKKFVPIDYVTDASKFTQKLTLPLETKVYTVAIMGLTKEISAQFGVDTYVNYRASIRYEIHQELNQYLSAFVNRPLDYPAHEYVAKMVDNQLALPSSDFVEIASFSFNPMFTPSYSGRMVTNDFMFSFDLSKGFVDRNGNKVEIDFNSLQCLYVLDEKEGFVQRPRSDVFPDWQKLSCTPDIGRNNFFPKYITIVAKRGSPNPPNPPKPSNSSAPQPEFSKVPIHPSSTIAKRSLHPRNAASYASGVSFAILVVLLGFFALI